MYFFFNILNDFSSKIEFKTIFQQMNKNIHLPLFLKVYQETGYCTIQEATECTISED